MDYDARGAGAPADVPVRSASSITRTSGGMAVVQDDANFIALFNEDGTPRRTIALPAGEGGARHFDDKRGNKEYKLDLEGSVIVTGASGEMLLAFGSGSSPRRECIAVLADMEGEHPDVSLVHVPQLYRTLRRAKAFAGSELNIEGAVQVGDQLRLFGRGNGAVHDGVKPVNASCDLHWPKLLEHLLDPEGTEPPQPSNIVQYELGALDGVPLGFTDATAWKGALCYSAAAEDSPDAVRDGRVPGSAIGIIDSSGSRWAPITEASGALFEAKIEGLVPVLDGKATFYVVVDSDNPDAQSELCTVELRGPWQP
jgi:hypothetical protein